MVQIPTNLNTMTVMSKSIGASLSTICVLTRTWKHLSGWQRRGPWVITKYWAKWLATLQNDDQMGVGHVGFSSSKHPTYWPMGTCTKFCWMNPTHWSGKELALVSIAHSSLWSNLNSWAITLNAKGWYSQDLNAQDVHESILVELHYYVLEKPISNPLEFLGSTKDVCLVLDSNLVMPRL